MSMTMLMQFVQQYAV